MAESRPPEDPAPSLYIGIDPGKDGGIVAIVEDGAPRRRYGRALVGYRMPLDGGSISIPKLRTYLGIPYVNAGRRDFRRPVIALEEVRAVPVRGTKGAKGAGTIATSKSNFALGRAYGQIEAILDELGYEVERIPPHVWQGPMLGPKSSRRGLNSKAAAVQLADRLFPELRELVPWRGAAPIPDGIADAALLAEFLRLGRRRARTPAARGLP